MKESSWILYSENARVATDAEKVPEEPQQEEKNTEKVVRVSIQIEAGSDKEDVIERISKEALDGTELDIQNKDIAQDMFTANLLENKIEAVQAVSGVKSVTLVEADQLTEETEQSVDLEETEEETQQQVDQERISKEVPKGQNTQVIQKEKENNIEISKDSIIGLIVVVLVLVLLVGRKLHKRFR